MEATTNPDVSVIVPVYNSEKHLRECLDSIKKQSYKGIEIICIDDGSTDNSLKICKEYEKEDCRFKVVSKENGGPASARNLGIDLSRGRYISFIDADDYLNPKAYSFLIKMADRDNLDLVVYGANIISNSKPPYWMSKSTSPRNSKYYRYSDDIIFSESGSRPFMWLHFIKSDIIKDNDLKMDETLKIGEDQAFEMLYLKFVNRVRFTSKKFYNYRFGSENTIMTRYSKDFFNKLDQHAQMVTSVKNSWTERGLMSGSEVHFIKWAIDVFYYDFLRVLYCSQLPVLKKLMSAFESIDYSSFIDDLEREDRVKLRLFEILYYYRSNPENMISKLKELNEDVVHFRL